MNTKYLYVFAVLFLLSCPSVGQDIMFPYQENFAWQVKQIDEFMDRFNNADYTPIRQYLREEYNLDEVSRLDLVRSLFNMEREDWDQEKVVQFLNQVNDSVPPPYLDFYDKDWFAELDCTGEYQKEKVDFTMTLSLQVDKETKASRWIINSVQGDFLPNDTNDLAFGVDSTYDASKTLNPASFGTDFMALVDALKDTANLEGYVVPKHINRPLVTFMNLLYQRDLIFKQVDHITYHFLQINNWIFQVQDFHRQSTNSGWLINSIIAVNEDEKNRYRRKVLHLP
ncbi:hypothetical protein [Tunicatimonas pelagia]|uniref:hypothetical protein n=1 Tax=Tunicatimonas pelagia TaxID=931531 RepID=UPI0026660668|nr:hypothetical protein [Tunicatimonas pelagia]WKN43780.1 hypothetical protein P0M28_02185 [Tunicatimonas pelagia]